MGLVNLIVFAVLAYAGIKFARNHSPAFDRHFFLASCWFQALLSYLGDVIWRQRLRRILQIQSAPLPGDTSVSASWLTSQLKSDGVIEAHVEVEQVTVKDLQGNRGLGSDTNRLHITYKNQNTSLPAPPSTLILKMPLNDSWVKRVNSIAGGACREAKFFSEIAKGRKGEVHSSSFSSSLFSVLSTTVPRPYYSSGSPLLGYALLMEDVQPATGVNFFFGNQVWGMTPLENPRPPEVMLEDMFLKAADLHAKFWNDRTLLSQRWLKAVPWYLGEERAKWELAIEVSVRAWQKAKKEINSGGGGVKWSKKLVQVIDSSIAAVSWEKLQKTLKDRTIPFTLTHGDFHAANMLWKTHDGDNKQGHLLWVDWTEVAVWEPTTDLGQTMISDVKPEIWRKYGQALVRKYWERLVAKGVSPQQYPFEQCWKSYQMGAVERWIWMFPVLAGMGIPPIAVQYFHDQLLAYIEDHGDYPSYDLKPVVTLVSTFN